jgi:hypothetical protein
MSESNDQFAAGYGEALKHVTQGLAKHLGDDTVREVLSDNPQGNLEDHLGAVLRVARQAQPVERQDWMKRSDDGTIDTAATLRSIQRSQ